MTTIIRYNNIKENNHSFSAKMYEKQNYTYEKSKKLSEFLKSPLQKGTEVGSDAYITNKKFKFIRTSNINEESNLIDEKSCVGIPEVYFENQNLKKDQILIVKDGTLGNVAILDKDYPNLMISSGINVIDCDHPYYVYAILQHELFRKNFEHKVTSGSTISHAKDIFLNFDIPLPKNDETINIRFIEEIMKSIVFKENVIKEKLKSLNKFISQQLNFNGFENLENHRASYNELLSVKRLDAGYYSNKSIFIRNLITSYPDGYFFIPSENLKGGNTPKLRSESLRNNLKYKWIKPSQINDNGFNTKLCSINFKGKNNINKDTCLIINRTSKKIDGQSGKYVGIASFYYHSYFGDGHHNQGFYHLENYDKTDLITLVVLLNHPLYREYFGEISVGSKMKEIKKYNLVEIPFPKFDKDMKNKIKQQYFNETEGNYYLNKEEFEIYEKTWCEKAGIYDIYLLLIKEKAFLNKIIEKIYYNKEIEPEYSF